MLDLLRQLGKAIFVISLFINLVYLVSSLELGVSPSEFRISGNVNEKTCVNFTVYSKGYEGSIIVEDRWLKGLIGQKNLKMYKYSASEVDLEIMNNDNLAPLPEQIDEICFIAYNGGKYHGVIIYETEGNGAGVGSWVKLEVNQKQIDFDRVRLTGAVVAENLGSVPMAFHLMLFVFLFLILILAILVSKSM